MEWVTQYFMPTILLAETGRSILLWRGETPSPQNHTEPTSLFLLRLILVPLVNLALEDQEESQDLR